LKEGSTAPARRALAAIARLDEQLAALGPEHQRPVLEVRRKGPLRELTEPAVFQPSVAGPSVVQPSVAMPPIREADVIEYATELPLEEISTRYGEGLSLAAALRRQRLEQVQSLLLVLPSLASWSRDPSSAAAAAATARRCSGVEPHHGDPTRCRCRSSSGTTLLGAGAHGAGAVRQCPSAALLHRPGRDE